MHKPVSGILPIFMICGIAILFQSCLTTIESDLEKQVNKADKAIEQYLTENNIEAEKQPSGVYIEMISENDEGLPVLDDQVVGITYTMRLLRDNKLIESHTDTTNPLRFSNSYSYNTTSLHPAGLNYEIGQMRLGETFRFYIPSYQAYNNYDHGDLFPAQANFIIEVSVVELKTEEEIFEEELMVIHDYIGDSFSEAESFPDGLYYQVQQAGDGEMPTQNDLVDFHYKLSYLNGEVIDTTAQKSPVQIRLTDDFPVAGLRTGLLMMKEGEKAKLVLPSGLAFGKSVQVLPQKLRNDWAENGQIDPLTKPYSPVVFDVELININ
ncbi:FKBP-type peptidyl-prolyl cis-trans isomerase [Gracilimonas mengyeensis]|uniref:peptidylprolyl isomerase n=1 Tax=Gracilimonas mengyeensis TaxID=1302730 RepID=A0A521FCF0_9BACT|nr:FKBP-type peptidyl-prolyl cis-trans isomerase [Gracilimonas mengyeensis]SMO93835.1 FKBP-type peptidyl-prolyl cis-trans isomerase [Gracilimonas mengyeensis]